MIRLQRALVFGLFALLASNAPGNAEAADDCTAADKAAMETWFPHNRTPEPSTGLTSNSNCAFHVWSTQMFLWLTQTDPVTGRPRVLSQYSLDDLFAPLGSPASEGKPTSVLRLVPRLSKSDATDLDAVHQAGSAGVLVDQQNRAVYYSQFVNKTFYDFVRKTFFVQKPGATFDPAMMAAATGGKDFFAPGSLELKVSWKIVAEGSNSLSEEGVFTTPAEIYKLKIVDGKIVVDTEMVQKVTVALVGMHVAGVVEDHPEFIWATFEHRRNAPDLPPGQKPNSSEPVSDKSWTFYAADSPANAGNLNPAELLTLDEKTQKLDPIVNVFRQFAYGTIKGAPSAAANVANVEALNLFVSDNFDPTASPWRNYMEVGAVWMLPNTLEPNQFPIAQLRGSTMLSNATMETYTQSDSQCFSCHNTLPVWETIDGRRVKLPGTNFNLSHILVQEFFRESGVGLGVPVRSVR